MRSVKAELDNTPVLGSVERALAQGRSRKWRAGVAVSAIASAAAVAAIVVAASLLPGHQTSERDDGPAGESPDATGLHDVVEVGPAANRWIRFGEMLGEPAPPGAVLSRICEPAATCSWVFISADGSRVPAAEVSPGLPPLLDEAGPEGVTLSFDGRWLALDLGDAVRIQSLDPAWSSADPIVVEPAAAGRGWDVVAWGGGSLTVALAETDQNGLPTRYGNVDLMSGSTATTDAPQPERYGPVDDYGQGLEVARRVHAGQRVVEYSTRIVPTSKDLSLPMGQITVMSDEATNVEELLRADESLAGPDGLIEVRNPASSTQDEVWPVLTVFERDSTGWIRSGTIEAKRDAPRRLVDVEDNWKILGAVTPDAIVETRSDTGTTTLRARDNSSVAWEQQLDGDVQWIVPGVVAR